MSRGKVFIGAFLAAGLVLAGGLSFQLLKDSTRYTPLYLAVHLQPHLLAATPAPAATARKRSCGEAPNTSKPWITRPRKQSSAIFPM